MCVMQAIKRLSRLMTDACWRVVFRPNS
jgi:hypothetical protein